jgi:hypothetical protein
MPKRDAVVARFVFVIAGSSRASFQNVLFLSTIKSKQNEKLFVDGVTFPAGTHMLTAQLALFRYAPKLLLDPYWRPSGKQSESPYTGFGRHQHSMIITEMLRPNFEWNPLAVAFDQAFCENQRTAICGGGGTSKSWTAGDYGFKFWLCAMDETAVVMASTSIDAARKRIWKSTSTAYFEVTRKLRRIEQSVIVSSPKPAIRTSKEDFVHGIYVVPVEQGDVDKAVDAIKGYHAKRILMVRDESDAISQAIIDVEANLRIGTEEFQTIDLGNLPSSLNPLGKQMEIAPGKPITEALGLEWMSYRGIKCLRADGEQSPNIKDNGKWTGLMTEEDRADIERQAGGKNTRTYYVMVKGLPPPEGVDDTVMSEALLHAHNAFDSVIWFRGFITFASLDPGFGGDKCCYRTYKRGLDTNQRFRVFLDEIIMIPITTGDPNNPPEYQIAEKVKSLSQARGIPPEEFIADTTGIGSGVAATLQREWSPRIHTCEFGGAPSDMIVSDEDPRPAKEIYDRRVTELCFSIREYVQADIIRGMDEATALQLCQRRWDYKGKKKSVQKKEELPKSPNEADSLACGVELLRRKGIAASVQTPVKKQANEALEREIREQDFDSQDCYQEDYEVEEIY